MSSNKEAKGAKVKRRIFILIVIYIFFSLIYWRFQHFDSLSSNEKLVLHNQELIYDIEGFDISKLENTPFIVRIKNQNELTRFFLSLNTIVMIFLLLIGAIFIYGKIGNGKELESESEMIPTNLS